MGRVQDKVALVTGAASGIGFATAQLLLAEGAQVVLADIASDAAQRAAAVLGGGVLVQTLDVTREAEWIDATDSVVRDFGRLDILVNNAGIALLKAIEATTLAEWRGL